MPKDENAARIILLEDALLEYVARYGATELAVKAFSDSVEPGAKEAEDQDTPNLERPRLRGVARRS